MYARKLNVSLVGPQGRRPCPLKALDSFSMRNFTGESRFDDTLPVADGRLEAGACVPLEALRSAMQDWFQRKSYLQAGESVAFE